MNTDKEFVPYQPSLDMKELGFDGECFGLYHNDKTFYPTQCKSHEQFHGQLCRRSDKYVQHQHFHNVSDGLERIIILCFKYSTYAMVIMLRLFIEQLLNIWIW